MVTVLGLILFLQGLLKFSKLVPANYVLLIENQYIFVFSIVAEQIGKKGYKYFPHFLTIFLLILTFNLIGLLPGGFTVTSQIIVTLSFGFNLFFCLDNYRYFKFKKRFYILILP